MAKTIWKFTLVVEDKQVIEFPEGAEFLSIGVQRIRIDNGDLQAAYYTACMWMLVDPEARKVKREVLCFGTGHTVDRSQAKRWYIGTVQQPPFVWHFFWGAWVC